MRIIVNNETLDLKPGSSIELENTSPLFSKKGSMSSPVTLPDTPKNQRLLGFPGRADRAEKIVQKQPVQVLSGSVSRRGILNIISGEIEANIGFDEGEAYARMSKVKLTDMDNLPVYIPQGGDPVNTLIAEMTGAMGYFSTDYRVFPVITSLEENTETGAVEYYMALNEVGPLPGSNLPGLLGSQPRKIRVKIGNEYAEVDMPLGYGITPFLKLHVLLDLIWDYLGFRLVENPFKTHYQLNELCVLNNTYDTIVAGKLDYKHLMPDCTIEDILSMIWARFGATYFVDSNTKTVRIKFISELLNDKKAIDFSAMKSKDPSIALLSPKQMKFSAGRSFSKTKTDTETWDEMTRKCDNILNPLNHSLFFLDMPPYNRYTYVTDTVTGNIYYRPWEAEPLKFVSSPFFEWDQKIPDMEYEEMKSPDEQLPMLADVLKYCPAPFLEAGEYHENSKLRLNKEVEENQEKKSPLSVCFYIGGAMASGYYFGSIFGYLADGGERKVVVLEDGNEQEYDIDLVYYGKTGLVHHFFNEYRAFLRHADQSVEQSFRIPLPSLAKLNLYEKINVDGQKYLIDSFKQVLGPDDGKPVLMKLRSLKLAKPYNLEIENAEPDPIWQEYFWNPVNYMEDDIRAFCEKIVRESANFLIDCLYHGNHRLITGPKREEFDYLKVPTETAFLNHAENLNRYQVYVELNRVQVGAIILPAEWYTIEYRAGVKVEKVVL